MLELLFLLLPIAALYGWYMGQRSAKKDQETVNNKFSRDYVTGLNFLLSNQQEKAVDLFLSMLQKQEAENQIATESQFEAELTLGNLFRSRGEVDRALRIHQALDASPDYSIEQKLLAKQQLAKDFMAAGFYDRAENYYIMLLDEPEFAVNSLTQLMTVYQKTKEWKKAINVAEKLIKIEPDTDKIPLSHYYCEYAQAIKNEDLDGHLSALSKALEYSPQCARASILLGDYYLAQNQFQSALKNYEHILQQDPDFISEVIEKIKACYMAENDLANYELFLIRANQIKHNSSVDLALAEYIEQKDGIIAAHSKLYQQLRQYPSMITFHRFIHYQINEAEEGRAKESLMLLYNMVGARMKKGFQYRCLNCGYQSYRLSWHCPSCRRWEQIKPIHSIDSQIN
ncbi:lipopolysaccharide assembly protein LapB [Actinobacillus pleuropneumoniae]|uniref:Lipopolysaccharide assembly protein B n=1 Tax=Actinobacillus pleuropneumoniae serotype 3 (strain JL03) TaxID=434271 RepID=B0BP17_ACTPJ|nr:lipopolysaccharide assembly protein LapB [Actinobacillus pleuropneumoniae]ABY69302.1 predicted N-acetylglucosaminyl transferase [Actinobacillus pleuropneumoniae serovar 3 str. JL03]UKH14273.1 lipopolysaccharide assembly protein LapB [Actinobacillus pleuropneumoniae]UKH22446.1 lipopolysaccharide assembly protein LapB [Actinobacillus pleuropneumoniae]UKH40886.1 lipopolysaccharide assembly protein LapB [Actinobacillus pleuropneumoniae serovar 4 str. M62]UKH43451.1 lipopolysaccharide assembly p